MLKAILEVAETFTELAKDWITHLIALGLFSVYLALLFTHLVHPNNDADSVEVAKEIATILGPLVAVVFGFYFGERSGNSRAQAAQAQATGQMNTLEGTITTAVEGISEKQVAIDDLRGDLNRIRAKIDTA